MSVLLGIVGHWVASSVLTELPVPVYLWILCIASTGSN